MSDMESRLRQRLAELRGEYDKGQKTLQDLEGQAANLRATLLRISGAVQVLQESLGDGDVGGDVGGGGAGNGTAAAAAADGAVVHPQAAAARPGLRHAAAGDAAAEPPLRLDQSQP